MYYHKLTLFPLTYGPPPLSLPFIKCDNNTLWFLLVVELVQHSSWHTASLRKGPQASVPLRTIQYLYKLSANLMLLNEWQVFQENATRLCIDASLCDNCTPDRNTRMFWKSASFKQIANIFQHKKSEWVYLCHGIKRSSLRFGPHQVWPKHNSQVLCRHFIDSRMFLYLLRMGKEV